VAILLSGNVIGPTNKVPLHRAGLVLRWMTILGYTILVCNQATQANSLIFLYSTEVLCVQVYVV